jgi:dTDP-4-amino-4,6-dideoxygalactose transaminase
VPGTELLVTYVEEQFSLCMDKRKDFGPSLTRSEDAPADLADESRVPLIVPDLRGAETSYLSRCISENWVSSAGPFVIEFEQRMAMLTGRRLGVAMVNGTAALHLALVVAGVRPGEAVLVPDWTFAATANAVLHSGAVPFFVDVTRSTWTLDPDLVAEVMVKVKGDGTQRIGAVVAVHALGHPADMDPLRKVCGDAGVPLIEDAAGAIGAMYKGRPVGSLGDAAMFSFNGNKTVTAGGGGMVVTDNDAWAERLRSLSTQARAGQAYAHTEVGYNYRMTNLNAAVGLAQLERLPDMLAAKRAIAARYDAAVSGRDDLVAMPRQAWAESNCWMYSVRCSSAADADGLVRHLGARNIEARVFWLSLSSQKPYAEYLRLLTGAAGTLSGCVVSLPSSSSLTESLQERVIAALREWRGRAFARLA